MSITSSLAAFALRHTFNLSADTLFEWLGDRFADHSQILPKALDRANDRAWQAVGLALAGDSLFEKVKDLFRGRDLTALRDQIRDYLAATPTGLEMSSAGLRVRACGELAHLRNLGRLAAHLDRSAIARDLTRFGNTGQMAGEAAEAVGTVADALAPDAPHLAEVLRLAPSGGSPLLVTAFLFFLRREVETNDELARGLTFDSLRHLTAAQDRGLDLLESRTEGVLDQIGLLFDALGNWFATTDGKIDDIRAKLDKLLNDRHVSTGTAEPLRVTVTNEKERELLRLWRDELRKLPSELLEAADWSKLGDALAAGRLFAEAREAHQAAAANASAAKDRSAEAEAEFKAYRDACEQEKWDDALAGLKRAAELDPVRFAPFPLRRYEPIAILGSGGFGTVIRCRERLARGREVAVKAFHAEDLGRDVDEVFAEAHTLSELVAPGIVKVIHWDYAEPPTARPFLVMEYFPGVSLAVHLKQYGRLAVPDVLGIALGVAEGMTAAHRVGVIHRDLKPGNVLIRPIESGRWDVRVIDFGLAVRFSTVQASVSTSLLHRIRRDHSFAGTLEYASPEQKGMIVAPIGPRSDVYSFGKTMLEALLGTTEPTTRTWKQVPDEYREPMRDLFERCVEKDPEDRHPGFKPIAEALTDHYPAGREWAEAGPHHRVVPERAAEETVRLAAALQEREARDRVRQEIEQLQQARTERMEGWKQSGMPREWVFEHLHGWDQAAWVSLVTRVRATPFWPLDSQEMIAYLELLRDELQGERKRDEKARIAEESAQRAVKEQNRKELDRKAEEEREAQSRRLERQGLFAEWKLREAECGRRLRHRLNAEWTLRVAVSKKAERQDLAAEHRYDAINFYNLGNFDEAITKFDEAIRLDPKWTLSYYHRGLAYLEMEDYDEAIEDFDEAIRLDPKWGLPYYQRGQAWFWQENYNLAIQDLDEAIRLDPTNTSALHFRKQAALDRLFSRGKASLEEEDYDEAIEDFEEAIRLDPKRAHLHNYLGLAWFYKNDYDRAINGYDEAIRLDPKYAAAYNNRGIAWLCKNEYDHAISDSDRALRLDPKNTSAYYCRGTSWLWKNDYDHAISDFTKAIEHNPKWAILFRSRGKAWFGKREYDKAVKDYDEAIRLDPEDSLARASRRFAADGMEVLLGHVQAVQAKRLVHPTTCPPIYLIPEERRTELKVLAETINLCTRCRELSATRTQTVFGVGPINPDICFIGDAPGTHEDATGEPFVGRAGQLLNKIIAACGFKREEVYLCNALKCHPPNHRVQTPEERGNCRDYFDQQIALVRPKHIVCLGTTAAQTVLGSTLGIMSLRGTIHSYEDIPVVCTFHPSALLHNESWKKDTWEDMKLLLRTMGRPIPGANPS